MFRTAATVAVLGLGAAANAAAFDDATCANGACGLELLQVQARPKHGKAEISPECGPDAWSLTSATVAHSNLAGAGPDSGAATLVFGNVKPGVNLVVSAEADYVPNAINPAGGVLNNKLLQNGIGSINLATGSAATLTFEFQEEGTGNPVAMPRFAFSVFDTDHGAAHESREGITIGGLSRFRVSADTDLRVVQEVDRETTFESTLRGGKVDNPVSPTSLTPLQERRTFVAFFADGTTSFRMVVREENYAIPQGRNILFAGASGLICSEDANCDSLVCPSGFSKRSDAEFLDCAGSPCTLEADTMTCCFQQDDTSLYGPGSNAGWR